MVQTNRILMKKPLISIGGPTASGKSALGVAVAKRLNGEIVSVDSMQIYREMTIGTAKPSVEDMDDVTHHLIDIVSCRESFTAGDFVVRARSAIAEIISRGHVPILVGGTGMYFKALLYGYNLGGQGENETVRAEFNKIATTQGTAKLYEMLSEKDPERAAKIHPNDQKRLVRALELLGTNAQPVKQEESARIPHVMYVLDGDRARLYERINRRVEDMLKKGLIQEISGLLEDGISPDFQAMQAIGYKEMVDVALGKETLEIAKEKLKQNTRRYAKRQLTLFRHMEEVKWLNFDEKTLTMCDIISRNYENSVLDGVWEMR